MYAVCIDQNTKERTHQVQQMADVYNQSERVIYAILKVVGLVYIYLPTVEFMDADLLKQFWERLGHADDFSSDDMRKFLTWTLIHRGLFS